MTSYSKKRVPNNFLCGKSINNNRKRSIGASSNDATNYSNGNGVNLVLYKKGTLKMSDKKQQVLNKDLDLTRDEMLIE